jgi:hypothetical protein
MAGRKKISQPPEAGCRKEKKFAGKGAFGE